MEHRNSPGNCSVGPDDRLALTFVAQLCDHEALSATIVRMRKTEDEAGNEVARPQEVVTTDSGRQARQVLEAIGIPLPISIMGRVDQVPVSSSTLTERKRVSLHSYLVPSPPPFRVDD